MGTEHVQGWPGAQDPQAGPCLPPTGQQWHSPRPGSCQLGSGVENMHPEGLGIVTSPTMSEGTAQGALKAAKDKSRRFASLGLLHLTAHIRWV